jgi:hypothetical protein
VLFATATHKRRRSEFFSPGAITNRIATAREGDHCARPVGTEPVGSGMKLSCRRKRRDTPAKGRNKWQH